MRAYYTVEQGEGIAGGYRAIGATTTAIYSCMGIMFFNHLTTWGGLYHYPAMGLDDDRVPDTIESMIAEIRPSEIHLTPALDPMGLGLGGSDPNDVQDVVTFLQQAAPLARVVVLPARSRANYFFDGQLRINGQTNATEVRTGLGPLEDAYDPDRRFAAPGVDYYGINIERNP